LIDERYAGLIALGDAIKPDAVGFIKYLQDNRLVPVMLTGDNMNAAQVVANQLGINDIHADMRPADKIAVVQDYQKRGAVLMLGDGVNDSPALAQADIGVAIGAGTDVAINAADVVLVKSRPSDVQALLEIATAARRKMTENLWWGAGYNLIAIPLAAGVLIPVGFKLDPMFGAVLMSLSTVIVALNALTLRIKAVA
jgi:Cu2+-exporting ATPase